MTSSTILNLPNGEMPDIDPADGLAIERASDGKTYYVLVGALDARYVLLANLAAVALSGDYSDLLNAPALAAVATSGAYADLSGTPSLGSAALSAISVDGTDRHLITVTFDADIWAALGNYTDDGWAITVDGAPATISAIDRTASATMQMTIDTFVPGSVVITATYDREVGALLTAGNGVPVADTSVSDDSGEYIDLPPVVLTFTCPATSTSLTIPITEFTASDDVGVTGYLITETADTPALDDPGWSAVAQTEYVVGIGDHTLRGWAKDSAGNISAAATASCTVSVAELVVWLESDTGQYQESTKTTPATSTNDPVGAWADQSGNIYDVTQTTNDNRGALAINVLNGHSVVTFDGISDFLRRAAGNVGPWTAIVGDGWEVPGGFTNTGLVYDPGGAGSFWIGDFTNSKIINTTLAGAYIGEIVISAPPQGVALDTSDDTLWWADHSTNTIVHIQKDGTVLGDPIALAYDPNGCTYEAASDCLWVGQDATRNIFRYSCVDGSLQQTINLSATEYGTVDGIHYESSDDSLWITTDNHDRLIKCRASDGLALGAWKITGANSPECVTIVGDTLYFCNDAEYHEGTPDGNRVRTITIADLPPLDITIAIVVSANAVSGVDTIFAIGRPDDAVGVAIYFSGTTTLRFVARDGSNQISQDRTVGAGYRIIIVSVAAGNQATVRDNGAQSGAAIDMSSVPGCIISRREIGLAGNGNGPLVREADINVAEVAIFSRSLTLAEIQGIERSWASKFGISI